MEEADSRPRERADAAGGLARTWLVASSRAGGAGWTVGRTLVLTMLTAEQLEHFRARLLRDRAAAEERIGERSALIPETARELADDPADLGDQAALVEERGDAIRGNEDDRDLIERVEHALARLHEGSYGVSEVSGRPIPVERLEAIPWATTLAGEGPLDDDA